MTDAAVGDDIDFGADMIGTAIVGTALTITGLVVVAGGEVVAGTSVAVVTGAGSVSTSRCSRGAAMSESGFSLPLRITSTTRRLMLRPCSVLLSASGRNSPKPITARRDASIPRCVNKCTTVAARVADNSQFEGKVAVLIGRLSV